MPRGVKGSGKKAKQVAKEVVQEVVEAPVVKTRKAYPPLEERLVMVARKIDQLEKLNAEREALIAKTENTLNERKQTLVKSTEQLAKARAKQEKLIALQNRPAKNSAMRAEKVADKKKLEELYSVLKAKGKSVDDLLAALAE